MLASNALPEELERYRLPYRLEATSSSTDTDNSRGQHRRSRHGASSDDAPSNNSGSSSQRIAPDPVMSADTYNHFRVTFQEYIAQADRKFAELDANHDGLISRNELLQTCDQK